MKKSYGENQKITRKRLELIQHIDFIINSYASRGMRITVRQVYYQCVAKNIIENNKSAYEKISDVITQGRIAGLLDWDFIEDRTRYTRENSHWNNPQEILEAAAQEYKIDTRATQPFYIEAWIEKDSLVSILENMSRQLDIPCFSCRGFSSVTALHEASERLNNSGKKNIILYAGDHDPSGLKIAENIKERLNFFEADFDFKRIGLTLEQIQELNLPPYPAKEKDKNFPEYVKNTGLKEAWELDALPPEKLAEIFSNEINALTDFQKLKKLQAKQEKDRSFFYDKAGNNELAF